jgi:hypothetical protein
MDAARRGAGAAELHSADCRPEPPRRWAAVWRRHHASGAGAARCRVWRQRFPVFSQWRCSCYPDARLPPGVFADGVLPRGHTWRSHAVTSSPARRPLTARGAAVLYSEPRSVLVTPRTGASRLEERWRNRGDTERQEPARRLVPQAAGSREASAPVGRTGGDADSQWGSGCPQAAVDPGAARSVSERNIGRMSRPQLTSRVSAPRGTDRGPWPRRGGCRLRMNAWRESSTADPGPHCLDDSITRDGLPITTPLLRWLRPEAAATLHGLARRAAVGARVVPAPLIGRHGTGISG